MNTIYSGCIPDPWLEVAIKLQNEQNIKPVYWIGWDNYDKTIDIKQEIKNNFKNCIFHNLAVAWKGVFPIETHTIKSKSLDGQLIDKIAPNELIAIKMMDRLDSDRKSFLFEERQRHFRMLLSKWLGIIDELNVELFISPSIPHRVFDYALYVACKLKGVKTLMYKLTPFKDVLVPITDLDYMPLQIKRDYNLIKSEEMNVELSPHIFESINLLKKSYEEAEPEYMKLQKRTSNTSYLAFLQNKLKSPISFAKSFSSLFRTTKNYHKVKGENIEEAFHKGYQARLNVYRGRKYKNNLKDYYESICESLDVYEESFVFVALHYQPEETTCPSARHYVNQNLMIENLSEVLPPDIKIVVKEHSSQFHPNMEGHTGRTKNFYVDLLKIPNLMFVSSNDASFDYIDNALIVATATGTIGWEAIVRGKPVFIFGNAWYEYCDNVFRINSKEDIKDALSTNVLASTKKADYLSYAKAVFHNSIMAYHYKGYDERSGVSKKDSIISLYSSIFLALYENKIRPLNVKS